MPHPKRKSLTSARVKTAAVEEKVRQAEAQLHDSNEVLTDTPVGTVVTEESVQAALEQNLKVEGQLHDAVKELQVVSALLKTAEEEKASRDSEGAQPGRRSGQGVDSVLEHIAASTKLKGLGT